MKFKLKSDFKPAGDQPRAIKKLIAGLKAGFEHQTLLGVTGSGKTFTVANIIEQVGKPTLVIAHNKTLAAQLVQEYRDFFPNNAVQYFVSYYDFYQPEAYMPVTDTYIEKDAQINEEIDRLRHATTQALLSRRDVIVVASVSAIYGLGSPIEYERVHIKLEKGEDASRAELVRRLVDVFYERTNADLSPSKFRVVGNVIEVMPPNERVIIRIELESGRISKLKKVDATSRSILEELKTYFLFPAKHFVTGEDRKERALGVIEDELKKQLGKFKRAGKLLEAERLKRRTNYDLALIREIGYCNGIENYSRHLDGREEGEPPHTLLSYFPKGFLTIIDESHVTVPQIGGMYNGDRARKKTLVEHGFRLPSALDNRPLNFDEFRERVGQVVYTSATPAEYELEKSGKRIVEQIIRPTGLTDPEVIISPIQSSQLGGETSKLKKIDSRAYVKKDTHLEAKPPSGYPGQVKHLISEAEEVIGRGGRVIVTTLTKKMAEDFAAYLKDKDIKAEYLHSEIKTIERIGILSRFRRGSGKGKLAPHRTEGSGAGFDVIVGVNLLREGLDLPEVALIGILDADKEGFLRSETSLIQIIGRAARNVEGRVILYADNITGSIERAVRETNRRRKVQLAYNKKHSITPKTISKKISDITDQMISEREKIAEAALAMELRDKKPRQLIKEKNKAMNDAVKILDFETAAILRDEIRGLEQMV